MKVMVWNVNGIRAASQKGFMSWLETAKPAVLGLQETRARIDQIPQKILEARGYKSWWCPAERPGYSGVGLLSRREPLNIETSLGEEIFDREGRIQMVEFDRWVFFNVYFPNGNGKDRDNSRVPYKLDFYAAVLEHATRWRERGKGVVIGGDYNTAHREIDLKNWKTNQKTSGFLPEERAWIDRYLEAGMSDVLREGHPDEEGIYTWWSQRGGARSRNVGWRIDYLMTSAEIRPWVKKAWIEPEVMGSDHCPLGIDLVVPRAAP